MIVDDGEALYHGGDAVALRKVWEMTLAIWEVTCTSSRLHLSCQIYQHRSKASCSLKSTIKMVENTDLSAVLSRLAQFSQPLPQHHSSSETNQHPPYLNSFATTGIPNVAADTSKKSSELQQLGKPLIDPATITTWQEGLRCVTKIAAENKSFAVRIRRVGQGRS